jgi:parallel beta-helix repeat protein
LSIYCFIFYSTNIIKEKDNKEKAGAKMYPRKDKIIFGSICLLSSILIIVPVTIFFINIDEGMIRNTPIIILGDSYFDYYNFKGEGTKERPYIIEKYHINTNDDYGIYVWNTTKEFLIRDCFIEAKEIGIYIRSVKKGTAFIESNTCSKCSVAGIYIEKTQKVTIVNNICNENVESGDFIFSGEGIYLINSPNSTITKNRCFENYYGIFIEDTSFVTLTDNTCTRNILCGINLEYSSNITAHQNICLDNSGAGIYLISSSDSVITKNICSDNNGDGIYLYRSHNSIFENNTCIKNNANGITLYHSELNILRNNIINSSNTEGIRVQHSHGTITEYNFIYDSFSWGLLIFRSRDTTNIGNICFKNGLTGLDIVDSRNTTVINNYCIENDHNGINPSNSPNVTLINCTCSYNKHSGILFEDSSYNGILINNTCNYNEFDGITLLTSNNVNLTKNTCKNNQANGIYVDSSFCTLVNNQLINSIIYGLVIESSNTNNTIHHNTFIDNNLGGSSQASDDGTSNIWYDNSINEGNYWSDWLGVGSYNIDGLAGSIDPYPLSEPPVSILQSNIKIFESKYYIKSNVLISDSKGTFCNENQVTQLFDKLLMIAIIERRK